MEEVLQVLDKLKIEYKLVKHKPVYTIDEMSKLNRDIFEGTEICKNLFLRDEKAKRYFLVILCGEKQANLRNIQEKVNSRRLSFASPKRLKEQLNLEPGSVTPMGLINNKEKNIEVLIDKDLKDKELLAFHPNTNDASILISFADFMKFLKHCECLIWDVSF